MSTSWKRCARPLTVCVLGHNAARHRVLRRGNRSWCRSCTHSTRQRGFSVAGKYDQLQHYPLLALMQACGPLRHLLMDSDAARDLSPCRAGAERTAPGQSPPRTGVDYRPATCRGSVPPMPATVSTSWCTTSSACSPARTPLVIFSTTCNGRMWPRSVLQTLGTATDLRLFLIAPIVITKWARRIPV